MARAKLARPTKLSNSEERVVKYRIYRWCTTNPWADRPFWRWEATRPTQEEAEAHAAKMKQQNRGRYFVIMRAEQHLKLTAVA